MMSVVEQTIADNPGINMSQLEALCGSAVPPELAIRLYRRLVKNGHFSEDSDSVIQYAKGARYLLGHVIAQLRHNGRIFVTGRRGQKNRTYTVNHSYNRRSPLGACKTA